MNIEKLWYENFAKHDFFLLISSLVLISNGLKDANYIDIDRRGSNIDDDIDFRNDITDNSININDVTVHPDVPQYILFIVVFFWLL